MTLQEALRPTPSLLCQLGSVIQHFAELHSPLGRPVDLEAAMAGLTNPEVAEWMAAMGASQMLPLWRTVLDAQLEAKRNAEPKTTGKAKTKAV